VKNILILRLESTSRRHLLAEMVLVLANGAVPSADRLVFADHDVLGDLVEQTVFMLVDDCVM
jgi:hypothetical protein